MARRAGRPAKLTADARTLHAIKTLASRAYTQAEVAIFFGVARSTFMQFLATSEEARTAWDRRMSLFRVELRRAQFRMAENGSDLKLAWLGKQYLGQTDRRRSAPPTRR